MVVDIGQTKHYSRKSPKFSAAILYFGRHYRIWHLRMKMCFSWEPLSLKYHVIPLLQVFITVTRYRVQRLFIWCGHCCCGHRTPPHIKKRQGQQRGGRRGGRWSVTSECACMRRWVNLLTQMCTRITRPFSCHHAGITGLTKSIWLLLTLRIYSYDPDRDICRVICW